MRSLLPLLAFGLLTACSSSSTTGSSAASPASPPGSVVVGEGPAPTATSNPPGSRPRAPRAQRRQEALCRGHEVSRQVRLPAGRGRGGCYVLTFHPDGTAEHLLLDATESGTYRIEGNAVIYRSTLPDAHDDRYESTDGFRTLGADYQYAP